MEVYIEFLKTYKWYILAIAILLIVSISIFLFVGRDQTVESIKKGEVIDSSEKGVNSPKCSIYVDVSGAVSKPNVYCLNEGDLVIDAIKKAGGFKKDLVLSAYIASSINLAKPLVNNEKIYIPFKRELSCQQLKYDLVFASQKEEIKGEQRNCVSLNSGSLSELDSLNGIGVSLANKIIQARPFKSVEDLNAVSGVGDDLFNNLKSLVCL